MADLKLDKDTTALLIIDPYNDFISEGGKIWDRIKNVAEANDCVAHMLQVLEAARKAGLRVFYALHHRYRPGDYETWTYIAPIQRAGLAMSAFDPKPTSQKCAGEVFAGALDFRRPRREPETAPQEEAS